ncbi:hypothetical protein NIES2100_34930 [Calothrix sp. NIES-2100]|uniref:hypothetical protein n=1 Tax=Calothrix sp. NIES-2100 TaxID=1954172 RepID=UPI000B5E9890|nr:hypothetical protein NIES2100_34930 [Calothrix sp. NIES-2100]
MANIPIKDVFGRTIYMKATGSGTVDDPYITEQNNTIINDNLPLPFGASTEETQSNIKTLTEVSLGKKGHALITSTLPQPGTWVAIQVIEAATFSTLTCASTTFPAINVELPAGFVLYGDISNFALSAGKVIAYKG